MSLPRNSKKSEKMPAKVLYNLDNLICPVGGDPSSNIYITGGAKNRIARDRIKVSPSGALKDSRNKKSKSFNKSHIHQVSSVSRTDASRFIGNTDSV